MSFDEVRDAVVARLASAGWAAERRAEDPTMVQHIPQIVRINRLGLLTFDSQAGRADGEHKERAYCYGFVRDRETACGLTSWVSLNTDMYASLVVVMGPPGPDPSNAFRASASEVLLRSTVKFPVTVEGGVVDSTVSPFVIPAERHVAGPTAPPVPDDAACVLFVDLVWGRPAADGLFAAIESGLGAVRTQRFV